jgi:dCTP deaminase
MAVIRKSEIEKRLSLPVDDRKSLVITPLLEEAEVLGENSDCDAVDLRLGTYFLLPQVPPQPFFFPSQTFAKSSHFRVHVPLGRYLVVPAHQTVLGCTLEFLKLPDDFSGQILTKSSIARTFMVIETAPWIHPSYRGSLTLEIANVSNTPLLLYPGRFIGQLILLRLSPSEEEEKVRKLSGTYLGPVYPETPKFKDPEEDLRRIGIPASEFKEPGTRWWRDPAEIEAGNHTRPSKAPRKKHAEKRVRSKRRSLSSRKRG